MMINYLKAHSEPKSGNPRKTAHNGARGNYVDKHVSTTNINVKEGVI
jgi:hypothetical protein